MSPPRKGSVAKTYLDEDDETYDERVKSGYPRSFEKWGIDVVRSGYTLLPNHLLYLNLYLSPKDKIKPIEMFVLIIIISNWWLPSSFPAASKKYIADRCGISIRQVQRILSSLEERRLIQRMASFDSGGANRFDISPILRILRAITGAVRDKREAIQLELNYEGKNNELLIRRLFQGDDPEIPF